MVVGGLVLKSSALPSPDHVKLSFQLRVWRSQKHIQSYMLSLDRDSGDSRSPVIADTWKSSCCCFLQVERSFYRGEETVSEIGVWPHTVGNPDSSARRRENEHSQGEVGSCRYLHSSLALWQGVGLASADGTTHPPVG